MAAGLAPQMGPQLPLDTRLVGVGGWKVATLRMLIRVVSTPLGSSGNIIIGPAWWVLLVGAAI
jgi:hypothetical protein